MHTAIRSWQTRSAKQIGEEGSKEEGGGRGGGGGGGDGGRTAVIKSNNPHLAGGELSRDSLWQWQNLTDQLFSRKLFLRTSFHMMFKFGSETLKLVELGVWLRIGVLMRD